MREVFVCHSETLNLSECSSSHQFYFSEANLITDISLNCSQRYNFPETKQKSSQTILWLLVEVLSEMVMSTKKGTLPWSFFQYFKTCC